ncbi:zinc finger protein 862-like [Watersipora subatra]|uniref:zinc finger protein 862-like n=1 Tax=Watersipora subatra TaxID=2589382 RepID=UPI00355C43BD
MSKKVNVEYGGRNDVLRHIKSVKHSKHEEALKKTNKLQDFFQIGNEEIFQVTKAESLFTLFMAKHNLSFSAADHFTKLVPEMFPDSEIAKKYGCMRTKTMSMIREGYGPYCTAQAAEICQSSYFGLMIDETTDRHVDKQLAILARVFKDGKVVTKFIGMPICNLSTAGDLFSTLDKALRNNRYQSNLKIPWEKVIAFNSDNCSVMKGHRNGVIAKMRAVNPQIVDVGCICHMANLAVGKSLNEALFNVDELICDMVSHFKNSTKRMEKLREFQEFVGVEQQRLLKHCPTRWLSLRKCVERVLKQYSALRSYFGAHCEIDRPRSKVHYIYSQLMNPLLLPWLHFVNTFLEPFYAFNMKFQGEDLLIVDLYSSMERLIKQCMSCLICVPEIKKHAAVTEVPYTDPQKQLSDLELFVGTECRTQLVALEDEASQVQIQQFFSSVRNVQMAAISKMLELFPLASKVLKMVPASDVNQKMSFKPDDIRWLAKELGIFTQPADLDLIHQEWVNLQLDDTPASQSTPAKFWDAMALERYPLLTTLMRAILCIPHSNAATERVFSMLKKIHTEARADLCFETVNALIATKINFSTCCFETELKADLLKNLKKSAKTYNLKHQGAAATSSQISADSNVEMI